MKTQDEELPRRIGQYEILGAIGKGAMGAVYKGVQPSLNRIVAIKVLPDEFSEDDSRVERFEREAQAVALLNHPNVVQIIDKDRDGDTLYFVMEYVKGTSLDALLQQRRLTLHEAMTTFKGICKGLDAAHRKNIVHRDLNPRNVLVSEDLSTVKLADFGISRVEEISRAQGTLSTSELSMGTLHYMAPEQATNMLDVDHRADIYSAGVVLYEMLTGRVPVGRFSLPSQLNSEVPSLVDPLVLKCLATEPGDRYATMSQVMDAARKIEEELRLGLASELRGISRSTSRIFRKGTRSLLTGPARKRALLLGAAGLAAIAILAVAGLVFSGRLGSRGEPVTVSEVEPFDEPDAEETLQTALDDLAPPEVTTTAPPPTQSAPPPSRPRPTPEPREPNEPEGVEASAQEAQDLEVAGNKLAAGLLEPALADINQFLESYPESPLVPDAYLMLADVHRRGGRTQEALAAYVEIESRFADAPQAIEALYERAKVTTSSSGVEARSLYSQLAASHPESDYAVRGLEAKARLEISDKVEQVDPELGVRVPAALVTYRQLVALSPDHASAEEAFWQLGEMHKEIKRWDLAAGYYSQLGERFPQTRHDAWWEAGQLYEKRLDDEENAREAYRKVPSTSARAENAARRLNRLGG